MTEMIHFKNVRAWFAPTEGELLDVSSNDGVSFVTSDGVGVETTPAVELPVTNQEDDDDTR